jgi:site-specific recombinase XerD
MFNVVEISLCPSHSCISFKLTPLTYSKLAQLCRRKSKRLDFLRHGYAVHRLNQWIKEGEDINALYPYLSEYMGHSNYADTDYYLSLVEDFYPEMEQRLSSGSAGHQSANTTSIYLKVDVEGLRKCALDLEEVFASENGL